MPKTRSGVHGAAAGPTPQAAIKDQGDQISSGGHVTHGARAEPQNPENTQKNALDVGGEKIYMYD